MRKKNNINSMIEIQVKLENEDKTVLIIILIVVFVSLVLIGIFLFICIRNNRKKIVDDELKKITNEMKRDTEGELLFY